MHNRKSFLVTEILCILFGFLGIHRIYTGHLGIALLQALTLGCCGIWTIIDLVSICSGKYKDVFGLELEGYEEYKGVGALLFLIAIATMGLFLRSMNTG